MVRHLSRSVGSRGALALAAALALLHPVPASGQRSAVLYVTVATAAGTPLSGAVVHLPGLGIGGLTDGDGRLRLFDLPAGVQTVEVRHLGFETVSRTVSLSSWRPAEAFFQLDTRPIPLAEIRVEVPETIDQLDFLRGFHERKARGVGEFLTREDIERQGSTDLSNLLRTVPGLRAPPSQFGQSRIRSGRHLYGATCSTIVYMDGMRYRRAEDLVGIPTTDIEGVEIYRGRSELPAEFADLDANCGVIVIWTRRHRPSS